MTGVLPTDIPRRFRMRHRPIHCMCFVVGLGARCVFNACWTAVAMEFSGPCGCTHRRTPMVYRRQELAVPARAVFVIDLDVCGLKMVLVDCYLFKMRRSSMQSAGATVEAHSSDFAPHNHLVVNVNIRDP